MGRKGRKVSVGSVHSNLKECLTNASGRSGVPYRVEICGEERFIWTTSATNAVRICAYHMGAKAIPITPAEMVKTLRESDEADGQP